MTISRSKEMQEFIDKVAKRSFGRSMTENPDVCTFCGSEKIKPEDFKDAISLKEFSISHICQACQDKTFSESE